MTDPRDRLEELRGDEAPDAQIVVKILDDVTDRRGWEEQWDSFSDNIKNEIITTWRGIVSAALEQDEGAE